MAKVGNNLKGWVDKLVDNVDFLVKYQFLYLFCTILTCLGAYFLEKLPYY